MSMESERGLVDGGTTDCVWNTRRRWQDGCVEGRLSPQQVNHVGFSSPLSLSADSERAAAQRTGCRRGDVDRSKRLTSFSVADILAPRHGSSSRHHHHQQQQQQQVGHGDDEASDDAESSSTRSTDDLSSSVLSHTSSTNGPSPTGSVPDHCWAETDDHQHSTSRKFYCVALCRLPGRRISSKRTRSVIALKICYIITGPPSGPVLFARWRLSSSVTADKGR